MKKTSASSLAAASEDAGAPLIEIMDRDNRPVGVLPIDDAHRQMLAHRSVVIMLYDESGRQYLQKRSEAKLRSPGRWDVSARGHVLVGESTHEAAVRVLQNELGIRSERLRRLLALKPSPENGYEFVTAFTLVRPDLLVEPNLTEVSEGFACTMDELRCMIRDFRELMAPGLLFLLDQVRAAELLARN